MGDVAGVHRIRGDNNDAMPVQHCGRLDDAVRCWPDPLLFEPGTQHRYSIWGWVLVSAVVQGAAGHPFVRFMDREVFESPRHDARGRRGEGGRRARGRRRPDYSCLAGGAPSASPA